MSATQTPGYPGPLHAPVTQPAAQNQNPHANEAATQPQHSSVNDTSTPPPGHPPANGGPPPQANNPGGAPAQSHDPCSDAHHAGLASVDINVGQHDTHVAVDVLQLHLVDISVGQGVLDLGHDAAGLHHQLAELGQDALGLGPHLGCLGLNLDHDLLDVVQDLLHA